MIVAVEKPAESSIHRLVKGSAGPFSRTPALPHGDKVVRAHPRDALLHPVRPTLPLERAGVMLSDLILRWFVSGAPRAHKPDQLPQRVLQIGRASCRERV